MVRQGLSINITPDEKDGEQFYVMVSSSAWEGDRCIASRNVVFSKVTMPHGISAQPENGLWMADFLAIAKQTIEREFGIPQPTTVSDANGHVSGG